MLCVSFFAAGGKEAHAQHKNTLANCRRQREIKQEGKKGELS